MNRFGMTIPMAGVPLSEHRDWFREMVDLGYTDLWSSEAGGQDGFTPLAMAAAWAPEVRLGVAIIPAYTRGPALLAMSVASLAEAAPGRFVMGIGSSSDVIVERWNGIPFEQPYARVRDTVKFLRRALAGEKVDEEYETFTVKGYRLQIAPLAQQPPILVGALRQGMLKLAGRVGDGAILNWLSADDVKTVAPYVHAGGEGKEIVAAPTIDVPPVVNLMDALKASVAQVQGGINRSAPIKKKVAKRKASPEAANKKTSTAGKALAEKLAKPTKKKTAAKRKKSG